MSDPLLRVALPGLPPTLNHQSQARRQGGRMPTAATRAWQAGAMLAVQAAAADVPDLARLAGRVPLRVRVALAASDIYTWDLDNRVKALLDACMAGLRMRGLAFDDRYIVGLWLSKTRARVPSVVLVMGAASADWAAWLPVGDPL